MAQDETPTLKEELLMIKEVYMKKVKDKTRLYLLWYWQPVAVVFAVLVLHSWGSGGTWTGPTASFPLWLLSCVPA